ncbi:glycine cleavage system aminomethyltransferase GcvT [Caldisericum exile]|uniref:Aminomethyltransferase n=1 Tax=Caldisericum exile (strain DSM 21853 / NBRC 104410 / AZM16c01) TaxID=511051 RepID=A0A7U6GFJ2_CALEA|nr:glycine cleavage system aminomethyltransferase GcvT [Caldisericum exile]BAL81465.1 aminomethyltransferase [Caldisericum exile AZM16c01]
MENLKRTPLYEEHLKLGAQMIPFAGYEMPLKYTSIKEEHLNVRMQVGIFDVSHMGEIEIHGPDALKFAHYLVTNSVLDMKIGRVKYTPMCYEHGGEVDDLFVYNLGENFVLLVVNASNYEKDLKFVLDHKENFNVEIIGKTDDYGEVAIQGPKAEEFLKNYFESTTPLEKLGYFKATYGKLFGYDVIISRTGYTGEDGFEVYASPKDIVSIWNEALNKGKPFGIKPAGLGARDSLRFEVCYWLYGNDIDETTNPFEAGQDFAVKMDKEDFIGKSSLENIQKVGIKRKLTGFKVLSGGVPRHGMKIYNKDGVEIGYITSGNMSFIRNEILALGYVKLEYRDLGTRLTVKDGNRIFEIEIIEAPFIEPKAGKKKV